MTNKTKTTQKTITKTRVNTGAGGGYGDPLSHRMSDVLLIFKNLVNVRRKTKIFGDIQPVSDDHICFATMT
jgi:hypothetical protein